MQVSFNSRSKLPLVDLHVLRMDLLELGRKGASSVGAPVLSCWPAGRGSPSLGRTGGRGGCGGVSATAMLSLARPWSIPRRALHPGNPGVPPAGSACLGRSLSDLLRDG